MSKRCALPLSIWVTGATLPEVERERGSFADLIRTTVGGAWDGPWIVVDVVNASEPPRPEPAPPQEPAPALGPEPATATAIAAAPREVAGVIITGSPARIADQAPWMQRAQAELRTLVARGVPVLGICFGHQMLGAALGGRSGPNPRGREIGTVLVRQHVPDTLLGDAPRRFFASTTHLDTVLELPPGAAVLAATERDACAAVRFAPRAWGVQFHPEMDADVVALYITTRADALRAEGLDPEALLAACRDTPESAELLQRFARACAEDS
jgi:GMP synthase (glutamine-hydrolysing)